MSDPQSVHYRRVLSIIGLGFVGLWLGACAPLSPSENPPDGVCGNGILEADESCDDGNRVTEECAPYLGGCEICDAECQLRNVENPAVCGNGIVEGTEECDDGNQVTEECQSPDSPCRVCDSNCRYTITQTDAVCGNGVQEIPEQCDTGDSSESLCAYGRLSCQVCNDGCEYQPGQARYCGDGVLQSEENESCDDGNQRAGDGCDAECQIEVSTCGNGIVEGAEACDDGNQITEDCLPSVSECRVCDNTCQWRVNTTEALCGNGILEVGETCDDGNTLTEDCPPYTPACFVCDERCDRVQVERTIVCGDGYWEVGEQCDDGNREREYCAYGETLCAVCGEECRYVAGIVNRCGDGIVHGFAGESCDDGNTSANDGCDATCQQESGYRCDAEGCRSICGDGVRTANEACDDGNAESGDGCSALCAIETDFSCDNSIVPSRCAIVCGDGVWASTESCDDGNPDNGDGCSANCAIENGYSCSAAGCSAICGDGLLRGAETCDDGNTFGNDGCDSSCQTEFRFVCETTPAGSVCETLCGNGVVDEGEACDPAHDDAFNCTSTCLFETTCGDGFLDESEACDDGNQHSQDGCDAACVVEPGYSCEQGDPSTHHLTERIGPSHAAFGYVVWSSGNALLERLHTRTGEILRHRLVPSRNRMRTLHVLSTQSGVLALTQYEDETQTQKNALFLVLHGKFGSPFAQHQIPLPVTGSEPTGMFLVGNKIWFNVQGPAGMEITSVGLRALLAPDTCLSGTERDDCQPWTTLLTDLQILQPPVAFVPNETYFLQASGDAASSSSNWYRIHYDELITNETDRTCTAERGCNILPASSDVRQVLRIREDILTLNTAGRIQGIDPNGALVSTPWNQSVGDGLQGAVSDGEHLWVANGNGVLPVREGLALDQTNHGETSQTTNPAFPGHLFFDGKTLVQLQNEPGAATRLRSFDAFPSRCHRAWTLLESSDDLMLTHIAGAADERIVAAGFVSGTFDEHPSSDATGAGGRDGWVVHQSSDGHRERTWIWQSVDQNGQAFPVEDRVDALALSPRTQDIWLGLSACQGQTDECRGRLLEKDRDSNWQELWTGESAVATGAAFGTVVLQDDAGNRIFSQQLSSDQLRVQQIVPTTDGGALVAGVFQGGLHIRTHNEWTPLFTPASQGNQIFALRLSAGGELWWAKSFQSNGSLFVEDVTYRATGDGAGRFVFGGWGTGTLWQEKMAWRQGLQEENTRQVPDRHEDTDEYGVLIRIDEDGRGDVQHATWNVITAQGNNRVQSISGHPDGSLWVSGFAQDRMWLESESFRLPLSEAGQIESQSSFAFVARLHADVTPDFSRIFDIDGNTTKSAGVTPLDGGAAMVWLYSDAPNHRHAAEGLRLSAAGRVEWRRRWEQSAPAVLRPLRPQHVGKRRYVMGWEAKLQNALTLPVRISGQGLAADSSTSLGENGLAAHRQAILGLFSTAPVSPDCGEEQSCESVCGNGVVESGEECDDHNLHNLDGCSENCRIDPGFQCFGSQKSVCQSVCGDGRRSAQETCDDGNLVPDDGCSMACRVEDGFTCLAIPGERSDCGAEGGAGWSCDGAHCTSASDEAVLPVARNVVQGQNNVRSCPWQQVGEIRTCGTDTGTCTKGTSYCTNDLVWSACEGGVLPAAETCDGLDNDCDGIVDEGIRPIRCGFGACAREVLGCVDGSVAECVPRNVETEEVCNGLDDDCDGDIDEGLPSVISCGVGACQNEVPACVEGTPGTCSPNEPAVEICDGIDNDCNGLTDDLPEEICGTGACTNRVSTCVNGQVQACEPKPVAQNEICNGIDDDCDGDVDEELGVAEAGKGRCRVTVSLCVDGETQGVAPADVAQRERCNLEDDDCDGAIDENLNCRFACEMYRASETCCNLWYQERLASSANPADVYRVCTTDAPDHPCCAQATPEDVERMVNGIPDHACCDLDYTWVNHEPIWFRKSSGFQNERPSGTVCGDQSQPVPARASVRAAFDAWLQMYPDWPDAEIFLYAPENVCDATDGVVEQYRYVPARDELRVLDHATCGLLAEFYDEDFGEAGPTLFVDFEESSRQVTAIEECREGSAGYSYANPFAGEIPAKYRYLVSIPEEVSGYQPVNIRVLDVDGAQVTSHLEVIVADSISAEPAPVTCEIAYLQGGAPVFEGRSEARCLHLGGECQSDGTCISQAGGCILRAPSEGESCALEEVSSTLYFRPQDASLEPQGDCRVLAEQSFCEPDDQDCLVNAGCGRWDDECLSDFSTVRIYTKGQSCRALIVDEDIRDPNEPNRFGLDADDDGASLLQESLRWSACCRAQTDAEPMASDVELCCAGEQGCAAATEPLPEVQTDPSTGAQVRILYLRPTAEESCFGEDASYLSADYDLNIPGRKKLGMMLAEQARGVDFKIGNEIPRAYIFDEDERFAVSGDSNEPLFDRIPTPVITVAPGERFTLQAHVVDDDNGVSTAWRMGDGQGFRTSDIASFYRHLSTEEEPFSLILEATDSNQAKNWAATALALPLEERTLNQESMLDIVVKRHPDFLLDVDEAAFQPYLDTAGIYVQTMRFLLPQGTDFSDIEIAFNRHGRRTLKGSVQWNHIDETWSKQPQDLPVAMDGAPEVTQGIDGEQVVEVRFHLNIENFVSNDRYTQWIWYRFHDAQNDVMGATDGNPQGWYMWPWDFDVVPSRYGISVQYAYGDTVLRHTGEPMPGESAVIASVARLRDEWKHRIYRLDHNWTPRGEESSHALPTPEIRIDFGDGTQGAAGEAHPYRLPRAYTIRGTLSWGEGETTDLAPVEIRLTGDFDGDGLDNYEDPDIDNDGYCDGLIEDSAACERLSVCVLDNGVEDCRIMPDAFPMDRTQSTDRDGDGHGDDPLGCTKLAAGEFVPDSCWGDAFPDDPTEYRDSDADTIGDAADPDDDNDGLLDGEEIELGTHPRLPDSDFDGLNDGEEFELLGDAALQDSDGDGYVNILDVDSDGDDIEDGAEDRWDEDSDQDGLISMLDTDSDNDGVPDALDLVPNRVGPALGSGRAEGIPTESPWQIDVPPGLYETAYRFSTVAISGAAENIKHDRDYCFRMGCVPMIPLDAGGCLNGDIARRITSTASDVVAQSDFSRTAVEDALLWSLANGDTDAGDAQWRMRCDSLVKGTYEWVDSTRRSWGGRDGCHPYEYAFDYDFYIADHEVRLLNERAVLGMADPETNENLSYRIFNFVIRPGEESSFSYQLLIDDEEVRTNHQLDSAMLMMRVLVLKPDYLPHTASGALTDATIGEYWLPLEKIADVSGRGLLQFKVRLPSLLTRQLGDLSDQAGLSLPRAKLMMIPYVEGEQSLSANQFGPRSSYFGTIDLSRYDARFTAIQRENAGFHLRVVQPFAEVLEADAQGRLYASVLGLDPDHPELWPEDNSERLQTLRNWSSGERILDGRQVFVLNGFSDSIDASLISLFLEKQATYEAVVFLAGSTERAAELREQLFHRSAANDQVCEFFTLDPSQCDFAEYGTTGATNGCRSTAYEDLPDICQTPYHLTFFDRWLGGDVKSSRFHEVVLSDIIATTDMDDNLDEEDSDGATGLRLQEMEAYAYDSDFWFNTVKNSWTLFSYARKSVEFGRLNLWTQGSIALPGYENQMPVRAKKEVLWERPLLRGAQLREAAERTPDAAAFIEEVSQENKNAFLYTREISVIPEFDADAARPDRPARFVGMEYIREDTQTKSRRFMGVKGTSRGHQFATEMNIGVQQFEVLTPAGRKTVYAPEQHAFFDDRGIDIQKQVRNTNRALWVGSTMNVFGMVLGARGTYVAFRGGDYASGVWGLTQLTLGTIAEIEEFRGQIQMLTTFQKTSRTTKFGRMARFWGEKGPWITDIVMLGFSLNDVRRTWDNPIERRNSIRNMFITGVASGLYIGWYAANPVAGLVLTGIDMWWTLHSSFKTQRMSDKIAATLYMNVAGDFTTAANTAIEYFFTSDFPPAFSSAAQSYALQDASHIADHVEGYSGNPVERAAFVMWPQGTGQDYASAEVCR